MTPAAWVLVGVSLAIGVGASLWSRRRLPPRHDTVRAPDGRTVQIWYARNRARIPVLWGRSPIPVALASGGLAVGFGLLAQATLPALPRLPPSSWPSAMVLYYAVSAVASAVVCVLAVVDVLRRTTLHGAVIRRYSAAANPYVCYVAVDDGHSQRIRALHVSRAVYDGVQVGDEVSVTVSPWLRHVSALAVHRRSRSGD